MKHRDKSKKVIAIDPIADSRWDKFVLEHPFGWICHHSGWKQVIESSFGHIKGHYLAMLNDSGGIRAGLPLYEVRSWLTGNRLVSIPFATLSDPLINGNGEVKDLIEAAIELSDRLKTPRIEIRSLHSQELIDDQRFTKTVFFKHHYLDLGTEPEEMRRLFHLNCRRNVKKAEASGLACDQPSDERDLKAFHDLHSRTRIRLGLPPQPYRFFESLWNTFSPLGMVTLLLARRNKQLVAGQLYFKFKNRVSMEFEAWDRESKASLPNYFLIWNAIALFRSQGYDILDFGRTSVKNESLMVFKKRWGTHEVDLPQYCFPREAADVLRDREDSMAYRCVTRLCRTSPDFALGLLGRICYRHLG